MAYSKQTWTDDVSAVTGARMTHIEQGIYDNSLATDKINPSGTATTSAEIEEGQITDVIGFKNLKLKGQTSQYTTTGKNLFPPFTYSGTTSGVTINASDGKVTIKGTATESINIPLWGVWGSTAPTLFTLPAGTYTLSGAGTRGQFPRLNLVSNGTTTVLSTSATQTFSSDTNITGVFINVQNGSTVNTTFEYQIEQGSSATSYEPYTGKKASPNPDYPQEVENVSGYNVVKIKNKNLWQNANNQVVSAYGITLTTNDDNSVTMTGSATNSSIYFTNVKKIMAEDIRDGNYTISFKNGSNTSFIAYRLRKYDGTTKTEIKAPTTLAATNYTYTFNLKNLIDDNTIQVELDLVRYGTGSNDQTLYPQIEASSTASSYAKYQSNEYEINLGKNLIEDETFVQGGFTDNTGTKRISCRNIKLKANTTYTFSSNINYSTYNVSIVTSTSQFPTSSYIYDSAWKTATFSFTTGNEDVYANIAVKKVGELVLAPSDMSAYHFQIEKGSNATSYAPYFPPIELCKIGNYQDYIYKKDGKWWKHKAIGKLTFNGTENWSIANTGTSNFYYQVWELATPKDQEIMPISNYFIGVAITNSNTNIGAWITSSSNVRIRTSAEDTVANFKTWLSTNKPELYYVLATPIDEEITYIPLLRQLDELYNSGLYDNTNISQDNSSEAFILDLEACKNNINGIVEYIRR